MSAEFGSAGINFERFEAITEYSARNHAMRSRLLPLRTGRPWQSFEIGCLLSHYEVWNRIADCDDEFAAVFEDDVVTSKHLGPVLEGAIPSDADIVKLETFLQIIYVDRRAVRIGSNATSFQRLLSVHEGTAGYIVSRRAAKVLVEATPTFDEPVDHAIFSPVFAKSRGLRVYQCNPAIVIQGHLVKDMQGSSTMLSDRTPLSAERAPRLALPSSLLGRALNRVKKQALGNRLVIPFAKE